jgi:hypothetical protein
MRQVAPMKNLAFVIWGAALAWPQNNTRLAQRDSQPVSSNVFAANYLESWYD